MHSSDREQVPTISTSDPVIEVRTAKGTHEFAESKSYRPHLVMRISGQPPTVSLTSVYSAPLPNLASSESDNRAAQIRSMMWSPLSRDDSR